MKLAGQGSSAVLRARPRGEARGYAMAALLVSMSVMAVLMGALLPQWTTLATREKEQELVFRGNQYARAIGLFQRKFANAAPPSIDVLVEQRFLRKKYKDPITNDEFQPIYANQAAQGVSAPTGAAQPGQLGSSRLSTPAQQATQSGSGATGVGGIIGVTSKSKDESLKIYNGRNHYNEWAFVNVQTAQRPGQGVQPGGAGPVGRGQPGQQPGQQQRPGAFGMPPGFGGPGQRPDGNRPDGNRPGSPFSPGGSQPSRPPVPGQTRPPGA